MHKSVDGVSSAMAENEQLFIEDFSGLTKESSVAELTAYGSQLSRLNCLPDGSPVPPTGEHIRQARLAGWGASYYAVREVVGGVEGLQEAVGFITSTVLAGWTDQDWIDNGIWLSHALGTPEAPEMPRTQSLRKAAKLKIAPNEQLVAEKFGSLSRYQSVLGFINDTTLKDWTDQDWIDNGIWLSHMIGSPDQPAEPQTDDFLMASSMNIGPSEKQIVNRFGSIARYKDVLGYVTKFTLERWTDQDWIDNGIWLSHMIGSPDQPITPSKSKIEEASSVGVAPHPTIIRAKFGSIANYQSALGYSPLQQQTLDYSTWDRETYRQNGIWLSHVLGTPETPTMPRQVDIDQGATIGLCPGRKSVLGGFRGSIVRYQDALGFVNDFTLERWTDQDWIDNGIWLRHTAGTPEQPAYVGKDLLNQAARLNIGPSPFYVRKHFGDLSTYQEKIGQDIAEPQKTKQLSARQVLRAGRLILRRVDVPYLTYPLLAEEGIRRKVVESRFGALKQLNKRLGAHYYPQFSHEEVLRHGVQWALAHEGMPPTGSELMNMSKDKKGPTLGIVQKHFVSMTDYQQEVSAALTEYQKLREDIVDGSGVKPAIADHILRNFRPGEEYAHEALAQANRLSEIHNSRQVNMNGLLQMFSTSRVTALWEEDDFYYFGQHIHTRSNPNPQTLLAMLSELNQFGLTPYLDEIEEVFGSLEIFLSKSMTFAAQERRNMPASDQQNGSW